MLFLYFHISYYFHILLLVWQNFRSVSMCTMNICVYMCLCVGTCLCDYAIVYMYVCMYVCVCVCVCVCMYVCVCIYIRILINMHYNTCGLLRFFNNDTKCIGSASALKFTDYL